MVKKQKTCAQKTDGLLGQLISAVQASQLQLLQAGSGGADTSTSAISELNQRVGDLNIVKELNNQTKEVHSSIGKLGKVSLVPS